MMIRLSSHIHSQWTRGFLLRNKVRPGSLLHLLHDDSFHQQGIKIDYVVSSSVCKRYLTTVEVSGNLRFGESGNKESGEENKNNVTHSVREKNWYSMFEKLQKYKEKNGDCLVPKDSKEEGLGDWVDALRQQYRYFQEGKRKSFLDPQRMQLLENEGFVWNVYGMKWDDQYNNLKSLKEKYGHTNVPSTYDYDAALSNWVSTQRKFYKLYIESQPCPLTESRVNALNELEFTWDFQEAAWLERLNELKEYKENNGDCIVPRSYSSNPSLAKWVDTQRQQYKLRILGKKNNLTDSRIDALEKLGFVWDVHEDAWNRKFKELLDFVKINGHAIVTKKHNNQSLFRWVKNQRYQYMQLLNGKKSKLTPERFDKLHNVGFVWRIDEPFQFPFKDTVVPARDSG